MNIDEGPCRNVTQAHILFWVDLAGFLLNMKPQEFKNVGKLNTCKTYS